MRLLRVSIHEVLKSPRPRRFPSANGLATGDDRPFVKLQALQAMLGSTASRRVLLFAIR